MISALRPDALWRRRAPTLPPDADRRSPRCAEPDPDRIPFFRRPHDRSSPFP
ncbi:hypothetical protein RchiOBHm_Chr1g0315341 [Rosa chinensis]|uniref:Uncharacterized protein n=1 Tax=Rosa chinensis TaxID=74649 RepID=A0A2P6S7C8_ROSCH|nr:hypothetical protein RchiOBHm_Chr1g0315341 [Rosa chinensis]